MRKLLGLLLALFASPIFGQTSAVTATISDQDGTAWASLNGFNAPYTVTLVSSGGVPVPPGQAYRADTGATVTNPSGGNLDATGTFTATVVSSNNIRPTGTQWQFRFCSATSSPNCYVVAMPINASGTYSTQLSVGAVSPRVTGGIGVWAYTDTEAASIPNNSYYNITTPALRCYSSTWGACGAGVGGPPTGPAGGALSGTYPNPQLVSQVVVAGTPSGTDDHVAIQACLTSAATSPYPECYIPAGAWKTSVGLTCSSAVSCKIRGAGADTTTITATGTGYNTIIVGSGAGNQAVPTGYTTGIHFIGATVPGSPTGISAFQLDGMNQYRVDDVSVTQDDIGVDMINDNYGTEFSNLRACFGGNCNVGVNLRIGTQSGSDISFFNPWVDGIIAGFSMSGGGGGYHLYGGQVGGGITTGSPVDTSASILMGRDYLSPSTLGEVTLDVHGTSFENTNNAWVFRAFNQVHLTTEGLYANPATSGAPAIGFYKNSLADNSNVQLDGTTLSGYWGATLISDNPNGYAGDYFFETGTYPGANQPYINGVQTYVDSMAQQSGIAYATTNNYLGTTTHAITSAQTFYATSFTGADPSIKVNACLTAAIAVGGTCDARGLGVEAPANQGIATAVNTSEQINVGNSLAQPVTLLLPSSFYWTGNMTDGTSCTLAQYPNTSIIGQGTENGNAGVFGASNTSNLGFVYCTKPNPGADTENYYYDFGFSVFNYTNGGQFKGNPTAFFLASGTYTSGITATGTSGQTCTLTSFNNGSTGTATVSLTGTNTIAGGTALVVTSQGAGATSAPTSATAGNGTATCSGTATVSTVIANAGAYIAGGFDQSEWRHFNVFDGEDTYSLELSSLCCTTLFDQDSFNGNYLSIPLFINSNSAGTFPLGDIDNLDFVDDSIVHNLAGSPLVIMQDTGNHQSSANFTNIYSEVHGDTSGIVQFSGVGNVGVNNWTFKAENSASTGPIFAVSNTSNTTVNLHNIWATNASGSWTSPPNAIVNNYSSVTVPTAIAASGIYELPAYYSVGKVYVPPSTTANAGINLGAGSAPTTPVNGDMWATSAGVYAYINGGTVGPFGGGSSSAPYFVATANNTTDYTSNAVLDFAGGNARLTGWGANSTTYAPVILAGATSTGASHNYLDCSSPSTGNYQCAVSGWLATYNGGAASNAALSIGGQPYTAGSTTTNYPQLYVNYASASQPTTLSANGTEIGSNAPSGFTGNFIDFHVNGGSSVFNVNYQGLAQVSALGQEAASNTGGTCTMSTTSCTITIAHTYTTPVCIATQQSGTLTGAAVGCTVSGTTVTVTAAVSNTETWGALVFGNPN